MRLERPPVTTEEAELRAWLRNFSTDRPDGVAGCSDSLEIIVDTGDFELEYTDAFINAKG